MPLRSPLAWLALQSIALYQRYLSPRKGYCCALHASGRGRSCSAYGYRAIARGGVVNGMTLLRSRLDACGDVHRRRSALDRQRGFCDVGCDVGDCNACDLADLGCSGCDLPWGRREKSPVAKNLDNESALRERVRRKMQSRD
jgi:putative component of membrane protein insertase Oxa1/YidC/SpoIIIJ protein YidD